jgi:20S proteasome alpha/beta subunit
LGKVEKVDNTAVGSGSRLAIESMRRERTLPYQTTLREAIRTADNAIQAAAADLYTAGLDIAVVTLEEIRQYGSTIDSAVEEAQRRAVAGIISQY